MKKKVSAPNIPHVSTRPICKHDYENIDEKDLPPLLPPFQAGPSTSTRPFRKHKYEEIAEKIFIQPRPITMQMLNLMVPKIPAHYHGSSSNQEQNVLSTRKITNLHGNSVDMSTDASSTRCV